MSKPTLTPKQVLFVEAYLKDPTNQAAAAIAAGYSERSAYSCASRMLKDRKVAAEIQKRMDARADRVQVKSDDVLRETMRLAFVDIGDAFDDNGQLLPLKKMSPEVRRALSSVKVRITEEDGPVLELKLWDKVKTLELLGRHLKLFGEHKEVEVKVTLEQLITQAAAEEKAEGESAEARH